MNLEILTSQVCELARTTGSFLLEEIGKLHDTDILSKGRHDYVTMLTANPSDAL